MVAAARDAAAHVGGAAEAGLHRGHGAISLVRVAGQFDIAKAVVIAADRDTPLPIRERALGPRKVQLLILQLRLEGHVRAVPERELPPRGVLRSRVGAGPLTGRARID